MKTISIVLFIASLLIMAIGIFLLVSKNYFSNIGDESKYKGSAVKINAIVNICIGIAGIILATINQIFNIEKNIILILFVIVIVLGNVIQFILKKRK